MTTSTKHVEMLKEKGPFATDGSAEVDELIKEGRLARAPNY